MQQHYQMHGSCVQSLHCMMALDERLHGPHDVFLWAVISRIICTGVFQNEHFPWDTRIKGDRRLTADVFKH